MSAERTENAPAVEQALAILELLGNSKFGLTLPELSQKTGWPKSSVHRLLVTLDRLGYLYRNERTGRHVLGLKLFSLANAALNGTPIRELATPYMKHLIDTTGLTVHLAILESSEAVIVSKLEPLGTCRFATWIGKRMEIHCTGVGKALIAQMPPDAIDRIIQEHGLPRHNDNTLSSPRKLKEDLERTARRGYSIDDEEDEVGVRCIGAPIFGPDGLRAAVSVSGTTQQITPQNLEQVAQLVKSTAAKITETMRDASPH